MTTADAVTPATATVGLVRGIVAERVVVSTPLDPFLSLRALAAYSGLSVRTLRGYLELAPHEALPCYRVGGKILVRRSAFDAWIEQYRAQGRPGVAAALRSMGLAAHTS
jgi:excisionase family DNA binding protein